MFSDNSLIRKNKLDSTDSFTAYSVDDSRKGEKVKDNEDQEDTLGRESFYDKVYHEVANLSNSVISVFQPLKKTLGKISESINEVFHFHEEKESQIDNVGKEKEICAKGLKRENNRSQSEIKDNSNQLYVKVKSN